MAKLKVLSGKDAGKEFLVEHLNTNIGRDSSNDIVLDEPSLSRMHAQIRKDGDRYEVVDQGSSNGTMVNERQVTSCELKDGDSIKLGEVELAFYVEDGVAAKPSKPQPSAISKTASKETPKSAVAVGQLEKAGKLERLLAYLIDGAVIFVFGVVVMILLRFVRILGILALASPAYFLLRDGIFKQFPGQSIGKKILKIMVVNLDTRQPIGLLDSLKRQIFMAIPILNLVECVLIFTDPDGRRIGDKAANTMVVNAE